MLNFNPTLKNYNPVLRESSFHFIIQKQYLAIEFALKVEMEKSSDKSDTSFFKSLENGLYNFLDVTDGNILPFLMQRHGIHQVAEGIILCISETETNFSISIKTRIEDHFKKKIEAEETE